jgi:hypothetical protein
MSGGVVGGWSTILERMGQPAEELTRQQQT